jgi:hypothetical protein
MKIVFLLACALGVLEGATDAAAPTERPDFLFIAVEDLRPELACYGQSQIKSPNIGRLAARGIVFTRAYCQIASCYPSRSRAHRVEARLHWRVRQQHAFPQNGAGRGDRLARRATQVESAGGPLPSSATTWNKNAEIQDLTSTMCPRPFLPSESLIGLSLRFESCVPRQTPHFVALVSVCLNLDDSAQRSSTSLLMNGIDLPRFACGECRVIIEKIHQTVLLKPKR